MHILFLSDNFPPEVNAPASRTFEHCREWVAAGHEVTVITTAPNFPKGKLLDGYRNRLIQKEEIAGIRVVRVWSYIAANEGAAKRLVDYVSFAVTGSIAGLFVRRPDVIVATSPQWFTSWAGCFIGTVRRRPWIFELRDIWPESIRTVGAMSNGRVFRWLERIELFLYRRAAAVVSVTQSFRENLASRRNRADKIAVVTNGADLGRYSPRPKDAELVRDLGLEGKFVAGYIGTHGMAHALETLLEAARLIAARPDGDRYRFVLLGDGAEKARLVARAAEMGVSSVLFLDTVPKDEVARYWSLLDASIVHLKDTPLFRTVIPSKLFECMAMGLPILLGVRGESAEMVEREGVGLTFAPESAEALVEAVVGLADDAERRAGMQRRGPAAARKYDRRELAQRMAGLLENVAAGRALSA